LWTAEALVTETRSTVALSLLRQMCMRRSPVVEEFYIIDLVEGGWQHNYCFLRH
jgi:hypothetical protein